MKRALREPLVNPFGPVLGSVIPALCSLARSPRGELQRLPSSPMTVMGSVYFHICLGDSAGHSDF